jgi:16S rRNA (guanine1207-N2)-methyltransferase
MKNELKPASIIDPATAVFEHEIEPLALKGEILLIDADHGLEQMFKDAGHVVQRWNRFAYFGQPSAPWIPSQTYDEIFLRIPNDRLSLEMLMHAGASHLNKGGALWIYGMNDEGMHSVSKKLKDFFQQVETRVTKRHARLVCASERGPRPGLKMKGSLSDWAERIEVKDRQVLAPLTYPGIFAHGRIDPGTQCLLANLPEPRDTAAVLDYGCGNGILSAALLARQPGLKIDMVDIYALAVEAAHQNVPAATAIASDGFVGVTGRTYDLIISNPPLHRGKQQETGMLASFIRDAKKHLRLGGEVRFVVQRTVPVKTLLQDVGFSAKSIGGDAVYEVWSGKVSHSV